MARRTDEENVRPISSAMARLQLERRIDELQAELQIRRRRETRLWQIIAMLAGLLLMWGSMGE